MSSYGKSLTNYNILSTTSHCWPWVRLLRPFQRAAAKFSFVYSAHIWCVLCVADWGNTEEWSQASNCSQWRRTLRCRKYSEKIKSMVLMEQRIVNSAKDCEKRISKKKKRIMKHLLGSMCKFFFSFLLNFMLNLAL